MSLFFHDFSVRLLDVHALTEAVEAALYSGGCDDATLVLREGVVSVRFHREARNMEEAVKSALSTIRASGISTAIAVDA